MRRDEHVALEFLADGGGIWQYESVTIAMEREASGDGVRIFGSGEGEFVAADFDQLAAAFELVQKRIELSALLSAQAQLADELLESSLRAGLAGDVFQDLFFGQHQWLVISDWWFVKPNHIYEGTLSELAGPRSLRLSCSKIGSLEYFANANVNVAQ